MKKLSVLLLSICPLLAIADDTKVYNKQIMCMNLSELVSKLKSDYDENVVFVGGTSESNVAITANQTSSTWTAIQYDKDIGCVLEAGAGFKINQSFFGKKISM